MLQRIQSIYLLLAALAIAALFIFPLINNVYVDGQLSTIKITGVYQDVNGQQQNVKPFTALSVLTGFVTVLPLVIIFLYNNRTLQKNVCYVAMLILIGFSFWVSQTAKDVIGDAIIGIGNYGIGVILLSLSILFVLLAQKAIQRDDKLVKSADRLR